jgi:hypothetical protein
MEVKRDRISGKAFTTEDTGGTGNIWEQVANAESRVPRCGESLPQRTEEGPQGSRKGGMFRSTRGVNCESRVRAGTCAH